MQPLGILCGRWVLTTWLATNGAATCKGVASSNESMNNSKRSMKNVGVSMAGTNKIVVVATDTIQTYLWLHAN